VKVILRFFGDLNFGDDVMVKLLLSRFPQHDFYSFNRNPDFLEPFLSFSNFHELKEEYASFRFLKNCEVYDKYLLIGGSVLMYNHFVSLKGQIKEIFLTEYLKKKGISSAVVGANISKLPDKWNKFIFLYVLKKRLNALKLLSLRDDYSSRLAASLHPGCSISRYADIVFGSDAAETAYRPEQDCLGISAFCKRESDISYFHTMAEICDSYCSSCGGQVKLFCFSSGRKNDFFAANEIVKRSRNLENLRIITYTGAEENFIREIGTCASFIPIRFHSIVLCMRMGIPFLPVIYSNKSENLLNDAGYTGESINYADISGIGAETVLKKLILYGKGSAIYSVSMEDLIKSSRGHFDELEKFLQN
jgi:colanic acid/amylovoran biosynthesis protein